MVAARIITAGVIWHWQIATAFELALPIPEAAPIPIVPSKNGRQDEPYHPMDHARPSAKTFTACIIEEVSRASQDEQSHPEQDPENALLFVIPALGNVRNEHGSNAEQGRDEKQAVKSQSPGLIGTHFWTELSLDLTEVVQQ